MPISDRHFAPRLEIDLKLAAHGCAQTVEKLTDTRAAKIVLNITRVEMIRNVENGRPDAHFASLELGNELGNDETLGDLHVERDEYGKAPRPVARTDEIQLLIYERERES